MDSHEPDLMEDVRVTVELDEGELECRILTIFTVDFEGREQDYIALLPVDENDEDDPEGRVFLYRYFEDEEGEPSLGNIETEEEYEAVSAAFDELPDEL